MGEKHDKYFDILIIGAGISGINAAYNLQKKFPTYSYAILEARGSIGGTWDLFRYPGIRSDSDLYTFSFTWHPWSGKPIADGALILNYIKEAAAVQGIDKNIMFNHRVMATDWCEEKRMWSVKTDGTQKRLQSKFVIFGTGFFDYETPFQTSIPGLENFKGQVIHSQFWPKDLDYTGKRVVIIGSGATAITLLPKLAEKASHVTMLQRSPSYILSLPNVDGMPWTPPAVKRLAWIILLQFFFLICKLLPRTMKRLLCLSMHIQIPAHLKNGPHFTPSYYPWNQRICAAPDGDFFSCLRSRKADVKTSTIKTVTENGILLNSTDFLEADIIITATGLRFQVAGAAQITLNGKPCDISQRFAWNGTMLQDIPNAFFIIGYTTVTWTLGAEVTDVLITRILEYMKQRKLSVVVPRLNQDTGAVSPRRLLNLTSTWIKAAECILPKAGDRHPWKPRQLYFLDYFHARYDSIIRGLEFMGSRK